MKSPDEVMRDLVRRWLAKAEEDFGVAARLLSEQGPYLSAIGFHSQQAAEKFLKAVLVRHQIDFPKTHDIKELLNLVATVDAILAEPLRIAVPLTPYGVDIRYPDDFPALDLDDARTAVSLAATVRESVLRHLERYLNEGSPPA